jgi:hypothetical protein
MPPPAGQSITMKSYDNVLVLSSYEKFKFRSQKGLKGQNEEFIGGESGNSR